MKRIRIALLTVTLASLAAGLFLRTEPRIDERALLRALAPEVQFSGKSGSPPHYPSGQGVVAFNSDDVVPGIRGYAGPVKTLIVLGNDGLIRGIAIAAHRETKNYVHYMESPAYLGRFTGKSVFDPFEVDRDIDGITRATVSVEALARSVRDSSRSVAASVFGLRTAPPGTAESGRWSWIGYALCVLIGGTGYVLTRRHQRYRPMRDLSLAAGLVIIGLALASPFSVLHVLNLLLLRPSSSPLWYAVVLSTFASLLVAGRFYCGWLCPFGALSELIARAPIRKWALPRELDERWRTLKYLLLAAITALAVLSGAVDNANYEVYITLFAFHGSIAAWGLLALALAANLRVPRFWCRYLCPVAALTGALSRRDAAYVSAPDCPMGNGPDPETSECIRCNRCYRPAGTAHGSGSLQPGSRREG